MNSLFQSPNNPTPYIWNSQFDVIIATQFMIEKFLSTLDAFDVRKNFPFMMLLLKDFVWFSLLGASLTGNTEPGIGHVVEHTVVLLLHVGDDIKHWVDIVRRRSHG